MSLIPSSSSQHIHQIKSKLEQLFDDFFSNFLAVVKDPRERHKKHHIKFISKIKHFRFNLDVDVSSFCCLIHLMNLLFSRQDRMERISSQPVCPAQCCWWIFRISILSILRKCFNVNVLLRQSNYDHNDYSKAEKNIKFLNVGT